MFVGRIGLVKHALEVCIYVLFLLRTHVRYVGCTGFVRQLALTLLRQHIVDIYMLVLHVMLIGQRCVTYRRIIRPLVIVV